MTLYNAASLPPAGANTLDACTHTAVVQQEEEVQEEEEQGEEEQEEEVQEEEEQEEEEQEEEVQEEEEGANNTLGFCVSSETPRQVKMRK